MLGRLEQRLAERHRQLEQKMDSYALSLRDMRTQVQTLEQQMLEMIQTQFCQLETAITQALQLPQDQALVVRQLINDQLYQLATTHQLRVLTEPQREHLQRQHATNSRYMEGTHLQTRNMDPRLAQLTHQMER